MCSQPYFIPEAANNFTQMCIRHYSNSAKLHWERQVQVYRIRALFTLYKYIHLQVYTYTYIVYIHLQSIHTFTNVYIHLHCIHTPTKYTYINKCIHTLTLYTTSYKCIQHTLYILYIHFHCIHTLTFYTYTYKCIQQGLCSLQIIFWKPFPAGSLNTCPPMSKVVAFRPELTNQRLLRILLQLLFRLILSPQQACSSITSLNSCSKFKSKFDQTYCYYLANKRFESLVHQQKEISVFNAVERKKLNKIFSNI